MELLDRTTGKVVDVPDDALQGAFQSGQYSFIKGDKYAFSDPTTGQKAVVDAKGAAEKLAAGHEIIPTADIGRLEREEKYGGETSAAGEFSRQFLKNITLNASDAAALAAAEALGGKESRAELAEKMKASEEQHEIASYVGAGAGLIAPMLVTGGASAGAKAGLAAAEGAEGAGAIARGLGAVGRAAAAPMEAVSALGGVGEKAAAAVLGKTSPNVVARIAQKAIAKGAGTAIEGALFGAANQLHEDALGDHALNGEKLAASGLHGAMWGGLLGAGLGGASEALSSGAKYMLPKVAPTAGKIASEQAVKSISYGGLAPSKLTKNLERLPGGIEGVGKELLNSKLVRAGETVEAAAPRIRQAADEAGANLTEHLKRAGAVVDQPKISSIVDQVGKDMEKEFGSLRKTHASTFSKVDTMLEDLAGKFPEGSADLEGLRDFRALVDKEINWNPVAIGAKTNPTAEALKLVRSAIEDHIEQAIDKSGEKLGGDALKAYQADKLRYRRLLNAANIADDSVTRIKKNQSASVSEKMMTGLGLVHAVASGNPLSALAGVAGSFAHHALMERGNSTAAVMLDKVAQLAAVQKTLAAQDARIEGALTKFIDNKPSAEKSLPIKSRVFRDESYEQAVREVKAASTDPEANAEHAQRVLGGTTQAAPRIARAAIATSARAAVYLASKLPQDPPPMSIQAQFDKHDPPSWEKEKFLRRVRATKDPASVLDDMSRGRATVEGVEAIKEVYPALFEQMQQSALEKVTSASKPLKYDQKLQLGILLDVPTDHTLQPDFIKRMQETYQGQEQSPGDKPQSAVKRPLEGMNKAVGLGQRRSE